MVDNAKSPLTKLFAGGGVLLAGLVVKQGISFLAKVIIARGLGSIDYGAVSIGIAIMTTASLVTVLGLHLGVSRHLPQFETEERRRGVLISAFQLAVPLSVAVGLVVAVFARTIATVGFNDPAIAPVIRVFGIAIPFAATVRLVIGGLRGAERSLPKVYIDHVTLPVARFGFAAVALVLGFAAIGIAWAYLLAYVATAAVSLYFLARHTSLLSRTPAASMHRSLLVFSLPLVVTSATNLVLSDIDIFILGYFWNAASVGVYNVIYPMAQIISTPINAFTYLFLPIIAGLHADGEQARMNNVYSVGTKWLFVLTFPAFVVLLAFPDMVIRIAFGAEYVDGATALSILALGFTIHTVMGFNSSALTAIGRTKLVMYDNMAAAALNVVLNLSLIPRFSFVGAAVATTISYVALNLLYSYHLYRETGIHPCNRTIARLGTGGSVLGAVFLGITGRYEMTVPTIAAAVLLFAVVYGLVLIRLGGIGEEEQNIVVRFEEEFDIDLGMFRRIVSWLM